MACPELSYKKLQKLQKLFDKNCKKIECPEKLFRQTLKMANFTNIAKHHAFSNKTDSKFNANYTSHCYQCVMAKP